MSCEVGPQGKLCSNDKIWKQGNFMSINYIKN